MLFGSKDSFALECEVDTPIDRWVNGKICLWIDRQQVGNYDRGASLIISARFFRKTLSYSGHRNNNDLYRLSSEQVLDTIIELERPKEFMICPGGGEAFDFTLAVLLEHLHQARMIWRSYNNKSNEVLLASGQYESVISSFLNWINPQVGYDKLTNYFDSKTFVFVGHLKQCSRRSAQALVQRLGGSVTQRITEATSYVVSGNAMHEARDKIIHAQSMGIRVITESEFLAMLPINIEPNKEEMGQRQ